MSLELNLLVAPDELTALEREIRSRFRAEQFAHSLNIGADLRIQIQTDPRYQAFVARAIPRRILRIHLPVARVEDVRQGKVWAVQGPARRACKRQKDLADIARLPEAFPGPWSSVPNDILQRLV